MYAPLFVSLCVLVCECVTTVGMLGLESHRYTHLFMWILGIKFGLYG